VRKGPGLFRRPYPVVRQYHLADCGPACLVAVLEFFGGRTSITRARELSGTNQGGTTLLGLKEGAEALGLEASGAAGTFDELRGVQLPCIAHVARKGLLHFVVVWEIDERGVVIGDPARGVERLDRETFETIWVQGAVLLVALGPHLVRDEPASWQRWVLHRIAGSSDWLIQAVFLGAAYTGVGLVSALVVQQLIDLVLPEGDLDRLAFAAALLLMLYLVRGGIGYLRERFVLRLNRRASQALADDFLGRLFLLPASFFDTRRRGDITARLQDAGRIQSAVLQLLGGASVDAVVVLGSVSMVFYFSVELGALITAVVPLYALLAVSATRRIRRRQERVLSAYGALQAEYIDALSGIEAIREHGIGRQTARTSLDLFDGHQAEVEDLGLVTSRIQSVLETLASVLFLAVLILGGVAVADGTLSLGQMLAAYSLTGMALPSLQRVIQAVFTLQSASAAADRIQDILLSDPEDPEAGRPLASVDRLELRDGSFRWRGALPQIDGLDFVLRRGEVVGLTGPNGSGKSTLISVLTRSYALTSGTLLVNGEQADRTRLSDFRRLVQVVPERVPLFKGSLGRNLFMGLRAEDHAKAARRLDHEGIHRFLARFPAGLATPVGEGGRQLSAGERQVVGLLRSLVTSPDVLILDEALSSLDTELRRLAIELIRRHGDGGSVLIVSHHAEVLAVANKVLTLTPDGLMPSGVLEYASA
jgi:ATP-binding cassette, subfamily C, bacteriocin exporter